MLTYLMIHDLGILCALDAIIPTGAQPLATYM